MTWSSPVFNKLRRVVVGLVILVLLGLGAYAWKVHREVSFQVITSSSMNPAISVGSLVVTRRVPPWEYRIGDVVAFRLPKQPHEVVVHRIISLENNENRVRIVRTKGDANVNKDTWDVSLGNVIGREIVAIPWVGYVFFYLRTLSGFLVVTLLSLVFLIAPEVYGLVGQWPRSRAKTAS